MDDEDLYAPTPEADEACALLPLLNMQQLGAEWCCGVCGATSDDPNPLDRCLSERVQLALRALVEPNA